MGRTVRWKEWGIEWEADKKHRELLMERFGFDKKTKALNQNRDSEAHQDEEWEEELLVKAEATEFSAAAARLNFLGQDSPELQYPAKEISQEMAKPKIGAWKRVKRVSRFLLGREAVIWDYPWQDEGYDTETFAHRDWG